MMAERGINDGSRRGWIMHREGRNIASRGKKYCVAREEMLRRDGTGNASRCRKKGFLERKTMSCGAENYE